MGNDNPFAALWTLIGAKLFSRDDGTSPLIGFNWSNSVNNQTIELTAQFRKMLGFEDVVRFEHHITETWKSIVRQPYNKRDELIELADHVANISAKHEGGIRKLNKPAHHPSDILDYFRDKSEIISSGDWDAMQVNFMDKVDATNRTAWALTEHGLSFIAAATFTHRQSGRRFHDRQVINLGRGKKGIMIPKRLEAFLRERLPEHTWETRLVQPEWAVQHGVHLSGCRPVKPFRYPSRLAWTKLGGLLMG